MSIELAAAPLGSIQAAGSVLLTASARVEKVVGADASIDVAFRVIDAEGKTLAERATRYPLGARADSGGPLAVRFTDRVDLPKGRQEIRLAINMPGGKTGSAVTYVDVPDFKGNRLTLSGLSVESAADAGIPVFTGGGSEPSDAVVTTERRFAPSATPRVRARVYGRLDRADDTLLVTALLRNEAGAVVRENLPASIEPGGNVSQERNFVIQVPLTGLRPAAYILDVGAGSVRNRRPSATRQLPLWVTEP